MRSLKTSPKRKITRKRNREWRSFFKKIGIFSLVFAATLVALLLVFRADHQGVLSPISHATNNKVLSPRELQGVADVKKALENKKIAFEDIKVSSSGAYVVRLRTGEDIILSHKKDLSQQLSSLQVIYSRLTMEGRSLRKLDLRYDKPVVVFK